LESPKVSVIIGAYNCEKFIEETIRSVMGQTFKDWELIVVDDGSSDNTCGIVQRIDDERIRLIRLAKNSGLPAVSRNTGIRAARGEYIAFLDHDDIWLPEKLSKQVELMEKDKDLFLVYSRCYNQKDAKIIRVSPPNPVSGHVFEKLFLRNCILCSSVMIRPSDGDTPYMFKEDKELSTVEDYDLWLSIAREKKISFIDEPLVIYRIHSQMASASIPLFFRRHKFIINKYSCLVPGYLSLRAYACFYANFCRTYLRSALRSAMVAMFGDRFLKLRSGVR